MSDFPLLLVLSCRFPLPLREFLSLRAEYFFTKIDKFDRIIHPRETTGDVYERKNKCFEYGNGLHNSEGSDVKSDCVSGKRVG